MALLGIGAKIVLPNEKWIGFALIVIAIYIFIIFGFKRERRPLNTIGIMPILWIVLGSVFLVGGAIGVWHGLNLAWPPAKNKHTNFQEIDEATKLPKNIKLRTQQEFRDYLNNSLVAVETNIVNYNNGDQTAWLTITSQLFIMLCDNIGGHPLIDHVIHNFSLHPLLSDLSKKNPEDWIICDDTKKHFTPEGIRLELFDLTKNKIPLEKWLQQTVIILNKTPITIGGMIKEVWSQAGPGHFSPIISETLQLTSGPIFREKGIERPLYIKHIVAIAEYMVPEIRKQLEDLEKKQIN